MRIADYVTMTAIAAPALAAPMVPGDYGDQLFKWGLAGTGALIMWWIKTTFSNASDVALLKQRDGAIEDRLDAMEKKFDRFEAKLDKVIERALEGNK